MTKERALEIERSVIYAYLHMFTERMPVEKAFYVGRIIGMMHETLKREIEKEIEPQE